MTNFTIGRWLLVALVIVALAFVPGLVSAHDSATTATDASPDNGTADDWATWMDGHMTDHMGPGSVEWIESHTGMPVNEIAQDMAEDDHNGRMDGQGHC
ncbi:hypothetical protein [Haloarcula nitratireducens]|uniref:Uncharacterized protein n=1 Tax=Haloarcula nitratireducens TaxID=2487749 RepID=A0AAW4PJ25_9EURY|nr:hypothetical protein [Halomicroarcula nitratireducens]MBX0297961.1 hypothetical protein [Halomicroarcula nitratireducens]